MKRKLGIAVFWVVVFLVVVPGSFAGESFDSGRFKEFIHQEMKFWNVPGAAILIIRDGKIIFAEGFGYRDLKNKTPVTTKTLFGIGSCSKAFTSMLLAMLADEKKIDFDRSGDSDQSI